MACMCCCAEFYVTVGRSHNNTFWPKSVRVCVCVCVSTRKSPAKHFSAWLKLICFVLCAGCPSGIIYMCINCGPGFFGEGSHRFHHGHAIYNSISYAITVLIITCKHVIVRYFSGWPRDKHELAARWNRFVCESFSWKIGSFKTAAEPQNFSTNINYIL